MCIIISFVSSIMQYSDCNVDFFPSSVLTMMLPMLFIYNPLCKSRNPLKIITLVVILFGVHLLFVYFISIIQIVSQTIKKCIKCGSSNQKYMLVSFVCLKTVHISLSLTPAYCILFILSLYSRSLRKVQGVCGWSSLRMSLNHRISRIKIL